MPLVSIGMPTFNSELTLRAAINSLLGQSFDDFELIISDNDSSDSTSAICQEFANKDSRIVYIRQPVNIGAEQNFKFVFDQGKGKYFLWAAGDDMRSSDFLEENVHFLETHADYVASTSPNCFEDQEPVEDNLVTFEIVGTVEERFTQFFDNCWRSHGIFYSVFRKDILADYKDVDECFDRSYGFAMDWQVDLFLAKQGNIHRISKGMTIIGVHGISLTGNPWTTFRSSFIEWIVPFYKFNPYVWKLYRDQLLAVRIKIIARLLKFNLAVSYRPLYSVIHRSLYSLYCRYVKPYLSHEK